MTLLDIAALSVRLGGRAVVDQVSLRVDHGEIVGLVGPNGAGKSSLLRGAMGLTRAAGEIRLGGDPIGTLTPAERARRVAYLPQERAIAWPLAVKHLVALGRTPHRAPGAGWTPDDHAAVAAAMRATDVAAMADRPASTLSGGERARVLIARALAQETPLLLADEPTEGLDPAHQLALMETFAELGKRGSGVLVSLHDLGLAARWCTRLIVLEQGRLIAEGPPAATLSDALLRNVYGVDAFRAATDDGPVVLPIRRTAPAATRP